MGKKVYIVIEAWDEGNNENVRAAFTREKKAEEYVDSKQGAWDYYELDLDTEQPDDSMRLWSVEVNMKYPDIMHQHDINWFIPKKDTFYVEQEGKMTKLIIFVEANRETSAFKKASKMSKKIIDNPAKYKGYSDLHAHFYNNVGDLYDFATGNKIEEYIKK